MKKVFLLVLIFISAGELKAQKTVFVEYSRFSDAAPVNNMKHGIADSVFKYISDKLDFIDYDDCNNCDSRAHVISGIIDKRFGIKTAKVWLFADWKRSSQSEKYRLKPEKRLANNDCLLWSWHVAPVIMVKYRSGYTDTLVIDPATTEHPVSIKIWAAKLLSADSKGFVIIKDSKYMRFPVDDDGKFDDLKETWQDESLLDADWSRSIENILQASYGIFEPWEMHSVEMRIKKMLGVNPD